MSLLAQRLNFAKISTIWPLLVVAGLLTVPAECARIGHPHSLFQGASAAPASPPSEEEGVPHSAADHVQGVAGHLPSWASPSGDIPAPSAEPATAPWAHPAHPETGVPATTPASPMPPAGGDLPVVEPAAATAIAAFGTTLALIVALTVLLQPGRPRAMGAIRPLFGLLARSLDPPPPRARGLAS